MCFFISVSFIGLYAVTRIVQLKSKEWKIQVVLVGRVTLFRTSSFWMTLPIWPFSYLPILYFFYLVRFSESFYIGRLRKKNMFTVTETSWLRPMENYTKPGVIKRQGFLVYLRFLFSFLVILIIFRRHFSTFAASFHDKTGFIFGCSA